MTESLMAFAVAIGLLYVARSVATGVMPGVARLAERTLRRLARKLLSVVVTAPYRRFGLWGLLCGSSVGVSTLGGILMFVALAQGQTGGAATGFITMLVFAALAVGFWLVSRWAARRRYTPRPLPTRRRWR